jgi:hypothetical protein
LYVVSRSATSSPAPLAVAVPHCGNQANDVIQSTAASPRALSFSRNAVGRQSVGARRLPTRPDTKQTLTSTSQTISSPKISSDRRQVVVTVHTSDSPTRFERGTAARSSLPIVRVNPATSGLPSSAGCRKPIPPHRVANCRRTPPPPPLAAHGDGPATRPSIVVSDVTETEMASASSAARSVHPVGGAGSSSPLSGRGTPKRLLPISAGSAKKQSSSSSSSRTAGNVDLRLKGERLSNYNKAVGCSASPASTPPSHRQHHVALPHAASASPLIDARQRRVAVEPLPPLCPDYVVHSPFAADMATNSRASPTVSSSSSFDAGDATLRRDADSKSSANGGTVITNQFAAQTSHAPPVIRATTAVETRRGLPLIDVRRAPDANRRPSFETFNGSMSTSLIDIGSSSPAAESGGRLRFGGAAGHRPMPTYAETDVEEMASGRREGRYSAGRKGGGLDWFGGSSHAAAGTLPRTPGADACGESRLLSPTSGLHSPLPTSRTSSAGVSSASTGSSSLPVPQHLSHQTACRTVSTPPDSSTPTSRLTALTSPTPMTKTVPHLVTSGADASMKAKLNSPTADENGIVEVCFTSGISVK